jgi:SAM-dependent methyltransferase
MAGAINMEAFAAFEAAGWEQKAAGYDEFFGQITTRVIGALLDAARVGQGDRVLDLASGPGYVAARAAQQGAEVVGVDVAEAMVALARQHHPELAFRRADAEALPFADGSFDSVVGNFLVHHLGRPERAISGFARVLAPGGRLALTVWDLPDRCRFLGVFLDAIAAAGASPPPDIPAGPDFFRFSGEEGFASLLYGAGFEHVELKTLDFTQSIGSVEQLWDGLMGGSVRVAAMIAGQPPETKKRIRAELEREVGAYRTGDHLEMPVSVKLCAGQKPLG